jgi:hypothetical protein
MWPNRSAASGVLRRRRDILSANQENSSAVKLTIGIVAALAVGVAAGWYLGYTRPAAKANRDARQYLAKMEHDDRMTVAVALASIRELEEQRPEKAKELLARPLGSYYVVYGPPGAPGKKMSEERMDVLRKIEDMARKYPVVQAAIDKSKQNVHR